MIPEHKDGFHAKVKDRIKVTSFTNKHARKKGTVKKICELRTGEVLVHLDDDHESVLTKFRRYEIQVIPNG